MPERTVVVQLIDGFATEEQSGGAAQFGIQLARHLDTDQFRSIVCGLWGYNTPSERKWRSQLHSEGIETVILIEKHDVLAVDLIRASAYLSQLIDWKKPQIINSHFERGDLLGLWSKLSHFGDLRIVRTMHTDQQWQTRPWLGQLLNTFAFPLLFNAEIAISEATRQRLDTRLSAVLLKRRSQLFYNGVAEQLFQQYDSRVRKAPLVQGAPHLAIIGRLELQKGHRYLLQAMQLVCREYPQAKLSIVGAGSLKNALQHLAHDLGVSHAVSFLGQRSDIVDFLQTVDVLVSASLWEGFPTVLLEAMAVGVPIVATDVSGTRELIRSGETGLLVAPGSSEELGSAINVMLNDPAWAASMADAAWNQARNYTIEATARKYDNLYRRLLDNPENDESSQ